MNDKTEKRIWRGLALAVLAVIAGTGNFACTSFTSTPLPTASPKAVAFMWHPQEGEKAGYYTMLCEDGSIWTSYAYGYKLEPDSSEGLSPTPAAWRWTPYINRAQNSGDWPKGWDRGSLVDGNGEPIN